MYEEEIDLMRNASAEENWDLFHQSMRSLLCLVSNEALLSLILDYAKQFIAEYLRINPQYETEYNIDLLEIGQLTKETIENVLVKFDRHKGEPGVNEFRKAIRKLHELLSLEYCTEIYLDTLISSITNLFHFGSNTSRLAASGRLLI